MNLVKIDTYDDTQQQGKSSVVLNDNMLRQQSLEEIQLQPINSKRSQSQIMLNVKKCKVIFFWLFVSFAALISLAMVMLQVSKLFKTQCKVTDLIDNKVSIQDCKGRLFKIRSQNDNRALAKYDYDQYDFKFSIDEMVKLSLINSMDSIQEHVTEVKKQQCLRATSLMEVVHNVNFKGEFVFDHYNFYPSPQDKAQTLFKLLQEEKQYLNDKYQISKYAHDQIGICVYIPSYNNAKRRLYLRNLDSVFQQEYQNYHVVYVNDASTDGTGDYVKSYMEENGIPAEKYVIINNEKNKGNSANVFNAGHNYCELGEIMVFLDGDDALIGRQVFSLLNAVYQKEKVALVYTQFLLVNTNFVTNGFSRYIPQKNLADGTFRSLQNFFSSHLKSMYVDVFRQIRQSDFKFQNGTFYNTASDVAYMTPAIELVGTRLKFLTQITYQYRYDTGINDGHGQQMRVETLIYKQSPLQRLENMSFADNPKTVHYQSP